TLPGEQVAGGTRQALVDHVAVDVVHQAAAVEAAFRGVAAVAVGGADQADGADGDRVGGGGIGRCDHRPVALGGGGLAGGRRAHFLAAAGGHRCGGGQGQGHG